MVVHVDFKPLPTTCSKCGSGHRPRRYGDLVVNYRDAPFLGRQVTIAVNMQRFRCADCGQAFFQELTGVDGKRRMTVRCTDYIVDQVVARSSLRDVAQIIGVDEKTVRNVLADREMVFSIGGAPRVDRFVCECCLGTYPKKELRLAPPKHFRKWRQGDLRLDANVCRECLDFNVDNWRAGMVRRFVAPPAAM